MTRDERLAAAKERALGYLDRGALLNTMSSILSDLRTDDELAPMTGTLGEALERCVVVGDEVAMRRLIKGLK